METSTTNQQRKKEYDAPEIALIPIQMSTVLLMSNENTHEEDLF